MGLCALLIAGGGSCVQPTKEQVVNFKVDMKDQRQVWSVGVRGSLPPLSWNEDIELKDNDGDSMYTGQVTLDIPYDFVELKFVKNGGDFELSLSLIHI